MKKILIVGNWKSNKTEIETNEWFQRFTIYDLRFTNKEIIICPPFTLLSNLKSSILNHKSFIKLGAQDISPFDEGAYTGEVNGKQIKEFADYVIIGHSERRRYFGESEDIIVKKIEMAQKYELTPIVCVSDIKQAENYTRYTLIIAYEPLFAIGSGNPDTPENANEMAKKIKEIIDAPVIYGGSVTSQNVKSFTQMPSIDGVLPGKASLDANEFASIIEKA
ncbi:MAG: triosephosphate isomerase [Candidatus Levyibacteriota bacterium]|nr:MAG: triosephosphate isomerase [Candidatus Levybacteria bacterium]